MQTSLHLLYVEVPYMYSTQFSIYRWLSASLLYIKRISNGDTAVLHQAINISHHGEGSMLNTKNATRSTQWAQTSTAPNLRHVKQSSQAIVYPKIFQNVPCFMPGLSWIFHQNPFTRLSVMISNRLYEIYIKLVVLNIFWKTEKKIKQPKQLPLPLCIHNQLG